MSYKIIFSLRDFLARLRRIIHEIFSLANPLYTSTFTHRTCIRVRTHVTRKRHICLLNFEVVAEIIIYGYKRLMMRDEKGSPNLEINFWSETTFMHNLIRSLSACFQRI